MLQRRRQPLARQHRCERRRPPFERCQPLRSCPSAAQELPLAQPMQMGGLTPAIARMALGMDQMPSPCGWTTTEPQCWGIFQGNRQSVVLL